MTKQIQLSGQTLDEFAHKVKVRELIGSITEDDQQGACYLCKRQEGKQSLGVHVPMPEDPGEVMIHAPEIELIWVGIEAGGREFLYPLCQECMLLLEGLATGGYTVVQPDDEEGDTG